MLTRELLRIDIRGKEAVPRWLKPDSPRDLKRAGELIELVGSHVGRSRGELNEAIRIATGHARDFKVMRGLAKLLIDRAQIEVASKLSPVRVRETVFALATESHPLTQTARARVVQQAAQALETTPVEIENALYADLATNQQIVAFKSIDASPLIHRYNVALVQGALLRSHKMVVELLDPNTKRLRQLLRYLKFFRLMYATARTPEGYRFTIDGPVSVVSRSTRYGLNLANFFPALLLCESWRMRAEYQRAPRTRRGDLRINSTMGLQSHYPDTGTWVAPEETALLDRMAELATPWTVSAANQLIDLGDQGAIVPDLMVRCPNTGKTAFVEIVWRWRKGNLKRLDKLLTPETPQNLVLAVCTGDANGRESCPSLRNAVHTFKTVPNAKSLLKMAKEVAC
jgi:predicted nuclease of restriction endonuclease-like RecB superfamily